MDFNFSISNVMKARIPATLIKNFQQNTLALIEEILKRPDSIDADISKKLTDTAAHLRKQITEFDNSYSTITDLETQRQLVPHVRLLGYDDVAELLTPATVKLGLPEHQLPDNYISDMIKKYNELII